VPAAPGQRPGAFLLDPVIFPAQWSWVDGRIGGIATGATIAADTDSLFEGGSSPLKSGGLIVEVLTARDDDVGALEFVPIW
jgi:hypothetical protein